MSVGGNIFREESFFTPLHKLQPVARKEKRINSVIGLLRASVWASVLGPWAAQYRLVLTVSWWDPHSYSHFTKEELTGAQIDEVTFLKRSQWRHIFKPGLQMPNFYLYHYTSISQLFYSFILPILLFGEHAISCPQEFHTCFIGMLPQLPRLCCLWLVSLTWTFCCVFGEKCLISRDGRRPQHSCLSRTEVGLFVWSRLANSEVCTSNKVLVLMCYVWTVTFGELPQQELNFLLLTFSNRCI